MYKLLQRSVCGGGLSPAILDGAELMRKMFFPPPSPPLPTPLLLLLLWYLEQSKAPVFPECLCGSHSPGDVVPGLSSLAAGPVAPPGHSVGTKGETWWGRRQSRRGPQEPAGLIPAWPYLAHSVLSWRQVIRLTLTRVKKLLGPLLLLLLLGTKEERRSAPAPEQSRQLAEKETYLPATVNQIEEGPATHITEWVKAIQARHTLVSSQYMVL